MNLRTPALLSMLLASAMLTACGGGGASGTIPTPGGGSTQSNHSLDEASIGAANSVGTPIKDYSDFNESTSSPAQSLRQGMSARLSANGACASGVEFYSPDKHGDTNSTERVVFYDSGCTQIARDDVRIFTSTGANSETVQRTVTMYAQSGSSPEAVRTETINYTNATFDQYGYPVVSGGFNRTSAGALSINGAKTIDSNSELDASAASGSTNTFCGDSAGFNATGNQTLNETFGWAGMASTGTRTKNSDGSVTWSATHSGSVYTGPIGSLSISTAAQNASCPISTPMFSLAGGAAKGSYSLPISTTFSSGMLSNLTISNATLANGDTLNVQTTQGVAPTASNFITGTLTNSSATQISSFSVNGFGDGTLTVTATGNTYNIVDWHVVK